MRKKGGRIYYSNRPGEWMENICSYIIWIYICLVFVRCKNYEILCRSNRHSCITAFATQSTLYCMYFVYCKLSWIVSLCLASTSVCFSHFRIRRSSSPCSEPEHFIERRLSPNIIKNTKTQQIRPHYSSVSTILPGWLSNNRQAHINRRHHIAHGPQWKFCKSMPSIVTLQGGNIFSVK